MLANSWSREVISNLDVFNSLKSLRELSDESFSQPNLLWVQPRKLVSNRLKDYRLELGESCSNLSNSKQQFFQSSLGLASHIYLGLEVDELFLTRNSS